MKPSEIIMFSIIGLCAVLLVGTLIAAVITSFRDKNYGIASLIGFFLVTVIALGVTGLLVMNGM